MSQGDIIAARIIGGVIVGFGFAFFAVMVWSAWPQ
jgi:hypothetical protein